MDDWEDFPSMPFRERSNTWPSCAQVKSGNSPSLTIPDVAEERSEIQTVKIPPFTMKKKRRKVSGSKTYAELITEAILSTNDKRMKVDQIYNWMMKNVDCFKDRHADKSSATWKNSIRYNLSRHGNFMKPPNEKEGQSRWWVLNPNAKSVQIRKNPIMDIDQPDVHFCHRTKASSYCSRPYTSELEIQEADETVDSLIEPLKLKEGSNHFSQSEEHTETHLKLPLEEVSKTSWWSLNPNVESGKMPQNPITGTDQPVEPFRRRTQSDGSSYRRPSQSTANMNSPNCSGISYTSEFENLEFRHSCFMNQPNEKEVRWPVLNPNEKSSKKDTDKPDVLCHCRTKECLEFEIKEAYKLLNSLTETLKLQGTGRCCLSGENTENHLKPLIEQVSESRQWPLNSNAKPRKMSQNTGMNTDKPHMTFRRRTQSDGSTYRRLMSSSSIYSPSCSGNSNTTEFQKQEDSKLLDSLIEAMQLEEGVNLSSQLEEPTETCASLFCNTEMITQKTNNLVSSAKEALRTDREDNNYLDAGEPNRVFSSNVLDLNFTSSTTPGFLPGTILSYPDISYRSSQSHNLINSEESTPRNTYSSSWESQQQITDNISFVSASNSNGHESFPSVNLDNQKVRLQESKKSNEFEFGESESNSTKWSVDSTVNYYNVSQSPAQKHRKSDDSSGRPKSKSYSGIIPTQEVTDIRHYEVPSISSVAPCQSSFSLNFEVLLRDNYEEFLLQEL